LELTFKKVYQNAVAKGKRKFSKVSSPLKFLYEGLTFENFYKNAVAKGKSWLPAAEEHSSQSLGGCVFVFVCQAACGSGALVAESRWVCVCVRVFECVSVLGCLQLRNARRRVWVGVDVCVFVLMCEYVVVLGCLWLRSTSRRVWVGMCVRVRGFLYV